MNTADIIKKRREELGLSQEELAAKLGYKSRSSINKIELGLSDIPFSKIPLFAKALEIEPEILMGWEEKISILDNIALLSDYELEGLNKILTGENSIESAYLSLDKKDPKEILNQILKSLKKERAEINLSKETHDFYINENLAGDIKYKNKKISIIMGDPKDKSTFKELDLNSDENIKLGTVISLIQLALEKVELDNQGYKGLENLISSIVIKNYNEKETQKKKLIRTKGTHSICNINKNVTELAALKGMHKK
ncbi:XRE family transcriptional regulator [Fusobacterium nucleatum YWH7199]|uniref:helix-turn-helix domain-containing protein n=1 Tax=Fusobacterium nucleatum TaxID=851 RepID=UPI00201A241E|nr:helix-turn-helix transcriptional regulator [Fusobacterium nucleatum]MCL4581435.1 XRE family transcriptional regulator [Fusobacterium nucleatum YWH7199]